MAEPKNSGKRQALIFYELIELKSETAIRIQRKSQCKRIRREIEAALRGSTDVKGFSAGFKVDSVKRIKLEE